MTVRRKISALNKEGETSGPLFLESLQPINLLSFGPDTPEIPLRSLNVLIGPNGSGKSNMIEAVCLLRATATNLAEVIRKGGGVGEWIWKGESDGVARVAVRFALPGQYPAIDHTFAFDAERQSMRLVDELIADVDRSGTPDADYYFVRTLKNGRIRVGNSLRHLTPETYDHNDSILAQRRDPEQFPEITHLAEQYGRIRAYREWSFGRNTIFRQPQRADMRNDRLEEDFSNLGLFLNRLRRMPEAKNAILARLRDLYEGVDDFDVSVEGGTVQVFFTEGNFVIPATRLSDGTLRYLCLLAILCDPTPPPLICLEEPELGLHPDILPKISDLLIEASQRTQLIVTTHSDILIDALTEQPESVLVCEKHEGQTHLTRLSAGDLSVWLEKYRLGELWTRGELGGTRW